MPKLPHRFATFADGNDIFRCSLLAAAMIVALPAGALAQDREPYDPNTATPPITDEQLSGTSDTSPTSGGDPVGVGTVGQTDGSSTDDTVVEGSDASEVDDLDEDEPVVPAGPQQVDGPTTLAYLSNYDAIVADHANYDHTFVGLGLSVGPHSAVVTSFVLDYIAEGLYSLHLEAGAGLLNFDDGDITYGPGYHVSLSQGFPFYSSRGSHSGRWVTDQVAVGRNERGAVQFEQSYYDIDFPIHRRFIGEIGLHHGVMEFDMQNRSTAIGFGFRAVIEWDVDLAIVDEVTGATVEDNLWGHWYISAQLAPIAFGGGEGPSSGGGVVFETAFPVERDRHNPLMMTMGTTYLPNEAWSARIGLLFGLTRS